MILESSEISSRINEVKKKTFLLVALSFITAIIYWKIISINLVGNEIQNGAGWPSIVCPFLFIALYNLNQKITSFAWVTGLMMSICIGVFLGAISGFFEKGADGLIIQTVLESFGCVFSIVYLYKNKFITVNDKFVHFTAYAFSSVAWIGCLDLLLSFIVLGWRSMFSGVSLTAIALNGVIIILAYLIFSIDLNIIDKKIQEESVTKNQTWLFSIELLVDIVWIYFAVLFFILRLRGRGRS